MSSVSLTLSIDAISKALDPLKRTRQSLEKLQDQAGKIQSYRKAQKALSQSSAKLEEVRTAAKKLTATKQAAGKAGEKTRRQRERMRTDLMRARDAFNQQRSQVRKLSEDLKAAGTSTHRLGEAEQRVQSRIEATSSKLQRQQRVLAKVASGFQKTKSVVSGTFSLLGKGLVYGGLAFNTLGSIGRAIGGIVMPFIDTAAKFERYRTTLEAIEGSSAKAKKSMAWISQFAAKTPYELDGVTASFVKLRSYGFDPIDGLLRTLGNVSAAMGKPLEQAVEAVADAATGEFERLKEYGIKASVQGNKIILNYFSKTGEKLTRVVKKGNRAMMMAALRSIWNTKYGGAMDKLSGTWSGMISNLGDQWTRFKMLVADSGAFDVLKKQLSRFLNWINEQSANGNLKKWAQSISDSVVPAINKFSAAMANLGKHLDTIEKIGSFFSWISDHDPTENLARTVVSLATGDTKQAKNDALKAVTFGFYSGGDEPTVADAQKKARNQQVAVGGGVLAESRSSAPTKLEIAFNGGGLFNLNVKENSPDTEVETTTGRNLVGVMP